ncbi:MAG: tRNA (adenosine(37)-N6)-dimethylallyltransferase MiaA [Thermodesulfobacteriota bacterium]
MKAIDAAATDAEMLRRFRRRFNLLVILGPTASGKTGLAAVVARRIDGEIISADSRQVYRGMNLGTGKDLSEYGRGAAAVPYHLIDILDPSEAFSVFDYQRRFHRCFREITARGKVPILVGGSGLYLEAVIRGYDLPEVPTDGALRDRLAGVDMETLRRRLLARRPAVHNTTDLRDRERLIRAIEIAEFAPDHPRDPEGAAPLSPLIVGIGWPRDLLRRRITDRLQARLAAGMVDEVAGLHAKGLSWEKIDSFGLEYRYIGLHLRGELTREELFRTLNIRIHQYAKRQDTWFRRMERKGVRIHWTGSGDADGLMELIGRLTA